MTSLGGRFSSAPLFTKTQYPQFVGLASSSVPVFPLLALIASIETRATTSTITLAASHSPGPSPPTPEGWPDDEDGWLTVIVTVLVSEKPCGPGSTALNVTV